MTIVNEQEKFNSKQQIIVNKQDKLGKSFTTPAKIRRKKKTFGITSCVRRNFMNNLDIKRNMLVYSYLLEKTEIGSSRKNKRLRSVLERMMAEPDDLGEDYWGEFSKILSENKFKI